jgi:hypothetical protein
MRHPLRRLMITSALFAGLAGMAHAETAPNIAPHLNLALPDFSTEVRPAPVANPGVPAPPTPDLADPADPQARPKLVVDPLNSEVFAKTSVDHHFGKSDGGATASAGVLCGRQPGHGDSGGSAAYGFDPHGRFVGGKLSFAF